MNIAYLCGPLVLGALIWLFLGIRRIGALSPGKPIADREGVALLLVDLQSVFWENGSYSEECKARALQTILKEVSIAKSKGNPVVALRQEWSIPSTKFIARVLMKGAAIEGSKGIELAGPFAELPDHQLVKRVQDGFETGELDDVLERLGVGQLRIVGLDFNYCVQKTALSAAQRAFRVEVIKSGCLNSENTQKAEAKMIASGIAVM